VLVAVITTSSMRKFVLCTGSGEWIEGFHRFLARAVATHEVPVMAQHDPDGIPTRPSPDSDHRSQTDRSRTRDSDRLLVGGQTRIAAGRGAPSRAGRLQPEGRALTAGMRAALPWLGLCEMGSGCGQPMLLLCGGGIGGGLQRPARWRCLRRPIVSACLVRQPAVGLWDHGHQHVGQEIRRRVVTALAGWCPFSAAKRRPAPSSGRRTPPGTCRSRSRRRRAGSRWCGWAARCRA
jgi:hypothetical protein